MEAVIEASKAGAQAGSSTGGKPGRTVFVDEFTDGMLDPQAPMLGPVCDGGHIVANTSPGCWGPMITPAIKGGHEVTRPVAVAGAEVGDAVALRIKDITVTSAAAASGVHRVIEGRNVGNNPYAAARCASCGTLRPATVIEGIGEEAIHCAVCGAEVAPFKFEHGYTLAFDAGRRLGVTLTRPGAEKIAAEAHRYAAMPGNSILNPVLVMAPAHLPGLAARLRPFMGQLGTTPGVRVSGMFNAGDAMPGLVGAAHDCAVDESALPLRTDGHLDCDAVRAGAILICPVKTPGAGIYTGDMHAMQGDGEIAGHTADVAGIVTLQVEVLKGLTLEGPLLFPVCEDLPYLARPWTVEERRRVLALAGEWGVDEVEVSAPISFIGSGPTINAATTNALERAAKVLGMSVAEVRNRCTITGAIEIARLGGVAQATFLAPLWRLDELGLGKYAREMYDIVE